MATKGKQDISLTGYKIDGSTYAVDTWYLHTNGLTHRENVIIFNNGASKDLSTGTWYIDLHSDNTVSTKVLANVQTVFVLTGGDSLSLELTSDTFISIQCDTSNGELLIFESDDVKLAIDRDS